MRFLIITAVAAVTAFPAIADKAEGPKIYPYHGANYCPEGLQPVQIDGVICCGTPNQTVSYAHVKQTPGGHKHSHLTTHTHVTMHSH